MIESCHVIEGRLAWNPNHRNHLAGALVDDDLDAFDEQRGRPCDVLCVLRGDAITRQWSSFSVLATHKPTPVRSGGRDDLGNVDAWNAERGADGDFSGLNEGLEVAGLLERRRKEMSL